MAIVVLGDPLAELRLANEAERGEAAAVSGLPWLFVGSLAAAEDGNWLAGAAVQRVLTVAARLGVHVADDIAHCEIRVDDHPSANLLAAFPEAFTFIDAAEAAASAALCAGAVKPPSLLVHCASGVSRSVGTVVGWLIARRGLSLVDALALVRTARPQGNPNVGFTLQA
jgi:hypothetical protein